MSHTYNIYVYMTCVIFIHKKFLILTNKQIKKLNTASPLIVSLQQGVRSCSSLSTFLWRRLQHFFFSLVHASSPRSAPVLYFKWFWPWPWSWICYCYYLLKKSYKNCNWKKHTLLLIIIIYHIVRVMERYRMFSKILQLQVTSYNL